ncbi:hypothetical protein B0H15DRAFT_855551 [Mycena belliarum]|uniref:Uncharacterized protein n=1 Tax=Mycena belliarum TaxID=1033014 RepID=A0AAD6TZL2_9AGAR|nr:hypothetical protein B0H15DRAFT_855551 [Mycena belliae]
MSFLPTAVMSPDEQQVLEDKIDGYIDELECEENPVLKEETDKKLRKILDRVHTADVSAKQNLRSYFERKVFNSHGALHKTLDRMWTAYLKESKTARPAEPQASSTLPLLPPVPQYYGSNVYLPQVHWPHAPLSTLAPPSNQYSASTPAFGYSSTSALDQIAPANLLPVGAVHATGAGWTRSSRAVRPHFAPASLHSYESRQGSPQSNLYRPSSHHSSQYSNGSEQYYVGAPGSHSSHGSQSGSMQYSHQSVAQHNRNQPSLSAFGAGYTHLQPRREASQHTMGWRQSYESADTSSINFEE